MTFEEYLNSDKKPWYILNINNNGNVAFRGKTVLSESNGKPLNNENAYTSIEMLVLFQAQRIKPKKGCNPKDSVKSGTLGCFMQFPEDDN